MLHNHQMSTSIGMSPSTTAAGATATANPNKRNKSRLMALLGIQAMAAASYFLLSSPSDSIDQHRSLMASPQSRSLMLHPPSGSSSSSKDWITWPAVQDAFRKLCGVDERTASFSRSLSIAALDNIIPQYLKSSGDKRFHRFLACNV